MKITDEELAVLPAKTKKHQAVVDLYRNYDFLEAYAKHTDMRVAENPEGAIGNHLEWDSYGQLMYEFLVSQGLKPEHHLLDVGCGTGRLARKVVPYLEQSGYTGVDISTEAIAYAKKLSGSEGWADKRPTFYSSWDEQLDQFDYAFGFSVFIHLPCDIMRDTMERIACLMHADSKFYFSFVPEKIESRTGVKQFRHRLQCYVESVSQAGLTFKEVKWPGAQKIALATLK